MKRRWSTTLTPRRRKRAGHASNDVADVDKVVEGVVDAAAADTAAAADALDATTTTTTTSNRPVARTTKDVRKKVMIGTTPDGSLRYLRLLRHCSTTRRSSSLDSSDRRRQLQLLLLRILLNVAAGQVDHRRRHRRWHCCFCRYRNYRKRDRSPSSREIGEVEMGIGGPVRSARDVGATTDLFSFWGGKDARRMKRIFSREQRPLPVRNRACCPVSLRPMW